MRPAPRRPATACAALLLAAALPASAGTDADTDRWVAWHRDFARRLEASGRTYDAAEEWAAVAFLRTDDPDPAARGAAAFVDAAFEPPNVPRPGDVVHRRTEQLVRLAVGLGGTHDPVLAYAIGRLQLAEGNAEDAQKMLGFARQRGFDPLRSRLWHYRAVIQDTPRLLEAGESDEAIRRLERVVRDFPDHPEIFMARIRLALSYRRRGEHVVAEKLLTELIAEAPWCARAHLALAEVYGDLSRWDEATASYRAAMDRAQERDDGIYTGRAVFSEAVLSAAYADLRRGELDSCEARAKQVQALQPESPDTFYLFGSIALRRGGDENLREGVRLLRRALRLAPEQREIIGPLIVALTQLGETDEAEGLRRKLEQMQEAKRLKAEEKYRSPRPASSESPPAGAPQPAPPAPGPQK